MDVETTESTETTTAGEMAELISAQGIEAPTDAELRGETSDSTETSDEASAEDKIDKSDSDATKADSDKVTDDKSDATKTSETEDKIKTDDTKTKDDDSSTEEDTANSEPKDGKAPKGYVPLAAVHEARGEIRYLKEQLTSLQTEVQTLRTKPEAKSDVPPDFEVLTEAEFDALADEDAAQAAIYLRNLNAHENEQRRKADDEKSEAEFAAAYESIIDSSVAEIEKVAPGIYDEGSTIAAELMEFAEDFGFTEDLYYLTDPTTKVILPGNDSPLLLGEQAASILGMLVNAREKILTKAEPNVAELTEQIRTELTAEITTELMKKFKNPGSDEYRSLNQTPKSETEPPSDGSFAGKVLTTAQISKLSDAELEAYLSGN